MEIIKETYPIARKEHHCMLCNCKIQKGQKYYRQTNRESFYFDGIYDFITHEECWDVALKLNMFDDCDEGLTDSLFDECITQYASDNYSDDEYKDLINKSYYDRIRQILADLEQENK